MSIFTDIATAEQSVANFVKHIVSSIEGDAQKVVTVLEDSATIADNLVNALKNFVTSPEGQVIEKVIEAVPGIGPYVADVYNFLPQLMVDLGWAVQEFTKSPAQIVQDGITKAVNAATANVKATNLITLQSHINTEISTLQGAPLPIQGAVTVAAAVHDPAPAAPAASSAPASGSGASTNTSSGVGSQNASDDVDSQS